MDERELVRTLAELRELIEEEHALELDRAAAVAPVDFEAAEQTGSPARGQYLFRPAHQLSEVGPSSPALKVGDTVDVVPADGHPSGLFGTVSAIHAAGIVVELGRPTSAAAIPPRGSVRLRADDNQRRIRLRAIERVVRERHALAWIGAVLTRADAAPLAESGWDPPAELSLTDTQRRALAGAARSQDVFLIQGPPGTGKTTVIAALLHYFAVDQGARVLLTSAGHRAIDNALDRLGAGDLHVLRLGQESKVTGAGQQHRLADVLAQAEQDVPQRHLAVRTELEDMLASLDAADGLLAELDGLNREIADSESTVAQREAEIETRFEAELEAIRHKGLRMVRPTDAPSTFADEEADEAGWGAFSDEEAGETRWRMFTRHLAGVPRLVSRVRQSRPLTRLAGGDRQALYRDAETWVAERRRFELGRQDLVSLREQVAALQTDHAQLTSHASGLPQTLIDRAGVRLPPLSVATPETTRSSLQAVRRARAQAKAALPVLRAWGALLEQPGALADALVDATDVVAATAIGVDSGRDGARTANLEFDVVIVDEAGQAQLTDLIVPLSRASIAILVGDHQQLAPYVDDDLLRRCNAQGIATDWLEQSVFEYLWERVAATHRIRLDLQFRMPVVIADFLSRVFYAGELATAETRPADATVCDLFQSAVVFVDTSRAADRAETSVSPGFLNRCEARLIADIAARLPASFRTAEGLGVIAPYAAQVGATRQALADVLGLPAREPWLVDNVATVDSFQGQERDVILVSLTRSNAEGVVGFVSDLNRLNVTLSRARRQLVVVGDLSTMCAPGGGPQRQAFARFARDLANHIRRHGEFLDLDELRRRLAGD